jgi:hypothetical protein
VTEAISRDVAIDGVPTDLQPGTLLRFIFFVEWL